MLEAIVANLKVIVLEAIGQMLGMFSILQPYTHEGPLPAAAIDGTPSQMTDLGI